MVQLAQGLDKNIFVRQYVFDSCFVVLCGNSSVVERDLAKVDVAGPTPVSR